MSEKMGLQVAFLSKCFLAQLTWILYCNGVQRSHDFNIQSKFLRDSMSEMMGFQVAFLSKWFSRTNDMNIVLRWCAEITWFSYPVKIPAS